MTLLVRTRIAVLAGVLMPGLLAGGLVAAPASAGSAMPGGISISSAPASRGVPLTVQTAKQKPRAMLTATRTKLASGKVRVSATSGAKKVSLKHRTKKNKKRTAVIKIRKGAGSKKLAKGSKKIKARARATKKYRASKWIKVKSAAVPVAPAPSPLPSVPVAPAPSPPPSMPAAPATSVPEPAPSPTSSVSDFDRDYAIIAVGRILDDIREVDLRMLDGIGVSSRLYLLSDAYSSLLNAGYPPGVDQASYYARIVTLRDFANLAGDEYWDFPLEASARYEVLRQETDPLLTTLNGALGTAFQLPAR